MQTAQSQHLRQLIETSTILTPGEKADWLDMLILMNDKQAVELEEILTAQPAARLVPAKPTLAPAKMPPLSHISNLPSNILQTPPPAPVTSAKPSGLPWKQQFNRTFAEKELAAAKPSTPKPQVTPKPLPPVPGPAKAGIQHPVEVLPPTPSAATPARPVYAPVKRRSKPVSVHLETLPDTAKLTVAAVRNMDPADLLVRLQQLARLEGYFNLLSYLEDSSLYRSYIHTGQLILAGQQSFEAIDPNDTSLLTKAEFETFADILRRIQLN